MPAIDAYDQDETPKADWSAPTLRDMAAGAGETAPVAPQNGSARPAMTSSQHPSSNEARAALWAGILGTAKHLGKRRPLPGAPRPTVVQLREGSSDLPVYFIGVGLFEVHLAQLIPCEHSIYAVEISWPSEWHDAAVNNNLNACPTLEQMVARYVAALIAHAGTKPCVLVGYSFHGSMAFEAAHQMRELGGTVETVLLLDAPAEYPAWYKSAWQNLRQVWAHQVWAQSSVARPRMTFAITRWSFFEAGKLVKRSLLEMMMRVPGKLTTKLDTLGRPMQWHTIERLYANSLRSYRLRRLDARGVIFRADRAEDCPSPMPDHSLGWSSLFGNGLEIVQVTGGHETMMRESPHDLRLACEMSSALDQPAGKPAQTNGAQYAAS
jgi:thioesterase domain-containing protein